MIIKVCRKGLYSLTKEEVDTLNTSMIRTFFLLSTYTHSTPIHQYSNNQNQNISREDSKVLHTSLYVRQE